MSLAARSIAKNVLASQAKRQLIITTLLSANDTDYHR